MRIENGHEVFVDTDNSVTVQPGCQYRHRRFGGEWGEWMPYRGSGNQTLHRDIEVRRPIKERKVTEADHFL